ncbi:YraN family protein [Paenibacillus aestuarii]|uniref:UPF0102 protein ACFPOG_08625 n=1 Tax=Paenibacillus aestuarii TaxID=516965 RepID=A0ABW0K6K1_9BACL|nr:YraN family protein [Paenibacillus aestuarii]
MNDTRKDNRKQLGNMGEALAESYLRERSYLILHRNWRCKIGEIDIVAEVEGILVFVEVRTRRLSDHLGTAKESVDQRKQRKIRDIAQIYLHVFKKYDTRVRFDVVTVELPANSTPTSMGTPVISHIEGAF